MISPTIPKDDYALTVLGTVMVVASAGGWIAGMSGFIWGGVLSGGGVFLLLVLSPSFPSSSGTPLSETETTGVTDGGEVSTDGGTSRSEDSAFEWVGDY